MARTQPNGRILGVDIIPAQPPKGVSTIQGNFLDPGVQAHVREFVADPDRGRQPYTNSFNDRRYLEALKPSAHCDFGEANRDERNYKGSGDAELKTSVDVVLSDMSAPWLQTTGFWKRSLSDPYNRMMNTSGLNLRDHSGSMVCLKYL